MRIGIIGGGPAGSWFAIRAAQAGYQVVMWEQQPGWEKPCGGGITERTFRQFPLLESMTRTSTSCTTVKFSSPQNRTAIVQLAHPIRIANRAELQTNLLSQATEQGAVIIPAKVAAVVAHAGAWLVCHPEQQTEIDFLVIAHGAGTRLTSGWLPKYPADAMIDTFMVLTPQVLTHSITIKFFPRFAGYLWEFPRPDQTSIGIGFRHGLVSPSTARRMLVDWLTAHHGRSVKNLKMIGRQIPALLKPDWRAAAFGGASWAAIGDAGGLADSLSGEGIYYALRSADILADCLEVNQLADYTRRIKTELGPELQKASGLRALFYDPRIQETMVVCLNASKQLQHITDDLLSGSLDYEVLRSMLTNKAGQVLWDLIVQNPLALPVVLRGLARILSGPTRIPWQPGS